MRLKRDLGIVVVSTRSLRFWDFWGVSRVKG